MAQIKTPEADLRSKYQQYIEISLILSLLILIATFKFSPQSSAIQEVRQEIQDIISVENVQSTKQEVSKLNFPKPPVPILSLTDEIEDITFAETDIFTDNVRELLQPPITNNRIIEDEEVLFKVVEDLPQIIGGLKSLQEKLYYTEIAKRIGMEGKVIVSAIIDKNGNVIDAEIYKSLFDDLDQIALKAVKELKFTPGMQRGKPVKVQIQIPIHFRLN